MKTNITIQMKLTSIISALIFLTHMIVPSGAEAQSRHLTSQNIGLGGGGTAYQDLYHANFINPANLMLNHDRRPGVTVGLVGGLYTNAGGSLLNVSTYNNYLTAGKTIEGTIADQMLDQWFGTQSTNMRGLNLDASVIPIGAVYRHRNWSVSAASRVRVMGNSAYSRGFADLIFRGLDSDYFNEAKAVDANHELLIYNEVSAGFAMAVFEKDRLFGFAENVRLYVGVAPKLLMASNYTRVNFQSTLRVQAANGAQGAEINHDFKYSVELAGNLSDQVAEFNQLRNNGGKPVFSDHVEPESDDLTGIKGTSVGVDFGATVEMDINKLSLFGLGLFRGDKKLRIGLSITDLGNIRVNDRARSFTAADNFIWHGISYDQNVIDEEFDGDESKYFESVLTDSIGNNIYGNLVTHEKNGFSRGLPTMISFGGHLILGKFSFMMDTGSGFVERGTNSKRMHLSVGTEYNLLNRIPLRVGYRAGGYSSSTYHAGTGLEFRNFEFSVGVASSASSSSYGYGIGAAWSGLVFHF